MAIFGSNKKEGKAKKATKSRVRSARVAKLPAGRANQVILAPWFSEKALIATDKGVYTFAIPREATKPHVASAIKELYKVTPMKIRIVNLPGARVSMRSRQGTATRARRRKAYVYLKPGETIQFA
jgi:large subunit ribosomal protein L23